MHELVAGDDVLLALVDDPVQNNGNGVVMAETYMSTALEHATRSAPLTAYRFSPNTVLTTIELPECFLLSNAGFQVLFRFAAELSSISLKGCELLTMLWQCLQRRIGTA